MAFNAKVRAAQIELNKWWEVTPKLATNGIWGADTQRGVRQFQKRVGLPQTGQLDAATLQRLGLSTVGTALVRAGSAPGGNAAGFGVGLQAGGKPTNVNVTGNYNTATLIQMSAYEAAALPYNTAVQVIDAGGQAVATTAQAVKDAAAKAGAQVQWLTNQAGNTFAKIVGGAIDLNNLKLPSFWDLIFAPVGGAQNGLMLTAIAVVAYFALRD